MEAENKLRGVFNSNYYTAVAEIMAYQQTLFSISINKLSDQEQEFWRIRQQSDYYHQMLEFGRLGVIVLDHDVKAELERLRDEAESKLSDLNSEGTEQESDKES